jgi:hypothetical protein
MKRIIDGCEIEWASERVFAVLQDHPSYGYLFEVSADQKRIVKCVHISPADEESDNTDEDARRFERDARRAVEELLCQGRILRERSDAIKRHPLRTSSRRRRRTRGIDPCKCNGPLQKGVYS